MADVQQRRIGIYLIFAAFLFSLFCLDQVSFTNNYVSFINMQYISVKRDQFSNNFVIQDISPPENKSRKKLNEFGFSTLEKIEDQDGERAAGHLTANVAFATKESKSVRSTSGTKHLSRTDSVSR